MQPTPALLSRAVRQLRLTPKTAGHDFYKGNRTGAMGRHTKRGGYVVEWTKVRTYVVPDVEGCDLTPFVSKRIEKPEATFLPPQQEEMMETEEETLEQIGRTDWELGPLSGSRWLAEWERAREEGWARR
ncbi:hypothetical protein ANO11243_059770 [Dothideomycetidae sp. 11243]|nr:hypothetical protein ANO11243_059770 [fungal sp. No.11243]